MILNEFNLDNHQLSQFQKYQTILQEESKHMNLTTIVDDEGIQIKHFYDSLLLSKAIDLSTISTMIDIGSGAGFPGIPLKIAFPHLQITLVEPTAKRCAFLNKVIQELGLEKIEVINQRAEEYIVNKREQYDLATARAVANLSILLELTIPFVKVNGYFIALKGKDAEIELNQAQNAISKLGCSFDKKTELTLPKDLGKRVLLTFKKEKKTSTTYPRMYAKIKKSPL